MPALGCDFSAPLTKVAEMPEPSLVWELFNSPPSVDFLLDLDRVDFGLASALSVTLLIVVCFNSFITLGYLNDLFLDALAHSFASGDIFDVGPDVSNFDELFVGFGVGTDVSNFDGLFVGFDVGTEVP